MGLGDYFSEKSEKDYILQGACPPQLDLRIRTAHTHIASTSPAEWKRETWELENYPEGEKKEMIELYVEEGMTVEDATTIVNAFAKCECALPSILSRICFVSGYCAACM